MEKPEKPETKTDSKEPTPIEQEMVPDISEDFDDEIMELMPKMNIDDSLMESNPEQAAIISDDEMVGLYQEILGQCRDDRKGVDDILNNFVDMVMNEGESSSASKEAIVNLLKIKSDTSDKMTKIADLMTRLKLKERDTFPRYLAAQQNNKVVIEGSKREMIKSVNKLIARNKKK